MNSRIWGIIGGVALVLALLSPLVLGNANKVKALFEEAEMLYEREDYEAAIPKYSEALQESKKIGVNTETIDIDFTTLANLKIAWCYYELGEKTSDVRHNQNALIHIKEVASYTQVPRYKEELTYLWAQNLYKTVELNQAESKFAELIETFPRSRWVPNALYTMAEIAYQQDNCEEALNILQRLVTEFPESEFTQRAERRIVELNELCHDPPPPPSDPCEEDYNTALDLQQQGKIYDAYERYTNLIKQFPDCEYVPYAYVGIAEIHLEAKDYVRARENYEEAIYNTTDEDRRRELYVAYHRTYLLPDSADDRRSSEPADELFVVAKLLRREKRWLNAAKIYEDIVNKNLRVEDTVDALYWLGFCYYKEDPKNLTLLRKSIRAFKRLINDHDDTPKTIEVYYYLTLMYNSYAEASEYRSKYQMLIDTAEEANRKYADSTDPRYHGWLNRIYKLKNYATTELCLREKAENAINEAAAAIAKAERENTDSQKIHKANEHLTEAKHQRSRRDCDAATYEANKAKEVLEISDPIPPPPPPPPPIVRYVTEGNRCLEQGKLEEALEKLEQALNLDRNYDPALDLKVKIKEGYYNYGLTLFDEERYDEAIVAFEDAISIDTEPKFKEAYNYLGVIYIGQGKYHDAIGAFSEAVRIDANFKEAYFNRALAHLELREFEKAIENAEEALRIDPDYEPARMLIELVLTQF